MKKLKRDIAISVIVSTVLTLMFICGIPLIVCYAGKNVALMAVGLAFTIIGFYGSPVAWTSLGRYSGLKRLIEVIEEDHLYSNKETAMQLSKSETAVKNLITKAINFKYLTGYLYDGVNLSLNDKMKLQKKKTLTTNKCVNCGAMVVESENGTKCPYCGTYYD